MKVLRRQDQGRGRQTCSFFDVAALVTGHQGAGRYRLYGRRPVHRVLLYGVGRQQVARRHASYRRVVDIIKSSVFAGVFLIFVLLSYTKAIRAK